MKEKAAIDKLRNIVAWANNMDEHFNDKVKNVIDWVMLYNLANHYDIEFIDELSETDFFPDSDEAKFMSDANKRLGYKLFNF